MVFKTLCTLFIAFLMSCGAGSDFKNENTSKTEVIVHYNNVEISRKNSKYIGFKKLQEISNKKIEFVIIFSADWCSACKITEKALKQAKLKTQIRYLNINEAWVKQLAGLMKIKQVPYMLHISANGRTLAEKVGPSPIVAYLITRF